MERWPLGPIENVWNYYTMLVIRNLQALMAALIRMIGYTQGRRQLAWDTEQGHVDTTTNNQPKQCGEVCGYATTESFGILSPLSVLKQK